MKILIIGGVAAGATAAARLRRLDESAEIILVERGPYVSYANCGLPYYIGQEIVQREALFVATRELIQGRYAIDVRDRTEAIGIDRAAKRVELLDHRDGRRYVESYDRLLLATGSEPLVPQLPGLDEADNCFTLWTVPDADRMNAFISEQQPAHATVVGGGFIGLEMAENLLHRGLRVTLVEMADQVMPPLDTDMARLVENELRHHGVELRLSTALAGLADGGRRVLLSDGDSIETDLVVLAIGVRPNSALAREAGLALNARGGILVDEKLLTSDPSIFAAGDAIEVRDSMTGEATMIPLAGPANRQGRMVAANLLAGEPAAEYGGSLGTSIVRIFDLSVASTGISEKRLRSQGFRLWEDYGIMLVHPLSHAGYFPGGEPLAIKLIYALRDLSERLCREQVLGAQIIGRDGVDKRIDVIASLLHFGGSVKDLSDLELAYAPPYSSAKDPVNLAAYAALNVIEGLSHPMSCADLDMLCAKDPGRIAILDVRNADERAAIAIPDSLFIPLPELRGRLGELDRQKFYVVVCAIGLRGYLAERILTQNGFEARNLMGGMRTWADMELARGSRDLTGQRHESGG